jgi:hypothetical protein
MKTYQLPGTSAEPVELQHDATAVLQSLDHYHVGGPHLVLVNTGDEPVPVVDEFLQPVGSVPACASSYFFVAGDEHGNRRPVLFT